MSGTDIKRFFRALFFLLVFGVILSVGMLPGEFTNNSLQISPFLYAWTAAFVVRRPGSVGIIVIIIAALGYLIYNDEGVALGALTYMLFGLIVHELRESMENQSYFMEVLITSVLFFLSQLFKNLILKLFFTHSLPIVKLMEYTLYFAVSYIIFALIIVLLFGRRSSKNVTLY